MARARKGNDSDDNSSSSGDEVPDPFASTSDDEDGTDGGDHALGRELAERRKVAFQIEPTRFAIRIVRTECLCYIILAEMQHTRS